MRARPHPALLVFLLVDLVRGATVRCVVPAPSADESVSILVWPRGASRNGGPVDQSGHIDLPCLPAGLLRLHEVRQRENDVEERTLHVTVHATQIATVVFPPPARGRVRGRFRTHVPGSARGCSLSLVGDSYVARTNGEQPATSTEGSFAFDHVPRGVYVLACGGSCVDVVRVDSEEEVALHVDLGPRLEVSFAAPPSGESPAAHSVRWVTVRSLEHPLVRERSGGTSESMEFCNLPPGRVRVSCIDRIYSRFGAAFVDLRPDGDHRITLDLHPAFPLRIVLEDAAGSQVSHAYAVAVEVEGQPAEWHDGGGVKPAVVDALPPGRARVVAVSPGRPMNARWVEIAADRANEARLALPRAGGHVLVSVTEAGAGVPYAVVTFEDLSGDRIYVASQGQATHHLGLGSTGRAQVYCTLPAGAVRLRAFDALGTRRGSRVVDIPGDGSRHQIEIPLTDE